MKCEIILGGIRPAYRILAMNRLIEWYFEWLEENHPEIFYGNKKGCNVKTRNQRTASRNKTKKYKKASLQK